MKNILGLDLGVGSCGWALIKTTDDYQPISIQGIGSRVIPLSTDDNNKFSKGNSISKNANRTAKRTQRKGYDRYQLRRYTLRRKLEELGMLPDSSLIGLDILSLWSIRANAAIPNNKITLRELGRVLLHLNQKRGYKHSKADISAASKQTEYVRNINERKHQIDNLGLTIGQFFAQKIKESEIINENGTRFYTYRTKDQVFPRAAYENEFDRIMKCQQQFYPNILTDEVVCHLRDIIYWQRPLKSCKHLVATCEFEKRQYKNKEGKPIYNGPKVAPRTSPLFQVCRIYEAINNISIKNRRRIKKTEKKFTILPLDTNANIYGNRFELDSEQREQIFNYLNHNEKITGTELFKILGLKKTDGWYFDNAIGKGIKGNTTLLKISKAIETLPNRDDLLRFNINIIDTDVIDTETGEIIREVDPDIINQPLYKLWHTIYSIKDKKDLFKTLRRNFGINSDTVLENLYNIDFLTDGFGNRSNKFMRKLIPYFKDGLVYSEASAFIGVNHSNSLTKEENENRQLLSVVPNIQKNELRQPIVEKILNQMINLVNAVKSKYGNIDEIRIELARELKQSKEERKHTSDNIFKREKENKKYIEQIEAYGLNASRSRVQKLRMHEETGGICIYCGQPISIREFLSGNNAEVEHVIPRSLFFDDSLSNKVCSCRSCNQNKGNHTAFDFMKSKSEAEFEQYLVRINKMYEDKKISKTKHDRLMTSQSEIPTEFINRDLRETQYIAKKAKEILLQICHNVYTTTGSVTDFFRHAWGYDEILADLNLKRYKEAGQTEFVEFEHAGQTHIKEKIIGWSKRMDHRHHAIDALTIALTRQGYIQRLNNLNTERDKMFAELNNQSNDFKKKHTLLIDWASNCQHFPVTIVADAIASIAVSFKAGKKVATPGKQIKYINNKRVVLQENILVPRDALSEESVYGKIKTIDRDKPIKYLFANPHLIINNRLRLSIEKRIAEFDNNTKKAIASLKKRPIFIDKQSSIELKVANCFKNELVIKYNLTSLKFKDIDSIVDDGIKRIVKMRFEECGNEHNEFVKSLSAKPLCLDKDNRMPIASVRCFTGLSEKKVAVVKKNEFGNPIGYAKPANNHHVALYMTPEGKVEECVVTFREAVMRKQLHLPVVISNPDALWNNLADSMIEYPEEILSKLPQHDWKFLLSMQQNEMFILGMTDDEYNDAISAKDKKSICEHLYRVQKVSYRNYVFRRHVETTVDNDISAKNAKKFILLSSYITLKDLNPHKVKVTSLGEMLNPENDTPII